MDNYYEKYIKYKSKYEHLKNQIGGGKQSAMDTFLARFDDTVKTILLRDRERGFLNFDDIPSKENMSLLTNIFEQIYTKVNKDNKNIDWIIKSYINNTFGRPSSLENFGRFTQALAKYKLLTTNIDGIKPIANINGLLELEDFLRSSENLDYFRCIEIKKAKQQRRDERNRTEGPIRAAGIDDKEVILETDTIIIYKPTSEAGSKYYGQETTWCTTSATNCRFDYYNNLGALYIIQSKADSKLKFQLHVEKDDLMDSKDKPVKIDFVKEIFHDEKLNKWFDEIWEKTMIDNSRGGKNIFLGNSKLFNIDNNRLINLSTKILDVKSLTFGNIFSNSDQILGDLLKNLIKLESLKLGDSFNRPLDDLLKNLSNLQSLTFGYQFNKPLGNSLSGLTNLQSLTFGNQFNKSLGNSLSGLTNLKSLKFDVDFNNGWLNLGDPFKNLINLQSLTFGNNFDLPLGDSLKNLIDLQSLHFGYNFNQPLDNSLSGLTNLESLTFGTNFNQPLGDSLKGLTNLKSLTFSGFYNNGNQPLNDSLNRLTNLKSLIFSDYFNNGNQPLSDSLKNLSNLESLTFGDAFNKPLGGSLESLINLKSLKFGLRFNQPLGNSLKHLTNLEEISFEFKFNNGNEPLGDSLKGLINLQLLNLGDFNKPLGDSLKDLPNLKILNGNPYP